MIFFLSTTSLIVLRCGHNTVTNLVILRILILWQVYIIELLVCCDKKKKEMKILTNQRCKKEAKEVD